MAFQMSSDRSKHKFYFSHGKRILDLALTIPALIALSPVLVVTAILVRSQLGSPVLFKQIRPGFHEKLFAILKFRTMTNTLDAKGNLLPDKQRLTALGKFLRKKSFDELPQLLNVIRGDMSLVGPRPLLVEYLNRYNLEQHRRHDVKPGITGWAQINGRQDLKLSQRIELDIWYVVNQSLLLDIKILFRSAIVVFHGKGIQPGQGPRTLDDLMPTNECMDNTKEKIKVKGNF
jgi:sugar transferase EpsL